MDSSTNRFFNACHKYWDIPQEKIQAFLGNWYQVTKTFGLSALWYGKVLSDTLREYEEICQWNQWKLDFLQRIIQETLSIVMDDMGMGPWAIDGKRWPIHYRLFGNDTKIFLPSSVVIDRIPILDSAKKLTKNMRENFKSFAWWLAVFSVIENNALDIVKAMEDLFLRVVDETWSPVITDIQKIPYVYLHLGIEWDHADQSNSTIQLSIESWLVVKGDIEKIQEALINNLNTFRDEMYEETFAK